MSQTLDQIFISNPSTTMLSTDLLYLVHSPYTSGQDSAITYANFAAAIGFTSPLPATKGGTGIANLVGSTITLGGAFAMSGAFGFTGTLTNTTAVTFPTTGTLATTSQLPTLPLSLSNGGTGASLVASNGGIFYSTASTGAVLSGTATANLPLLSGSTAAPTWGSFALALGGALTTAAAHTLAGAFPSTFTFTNTTSVTFPTSGTLATTTQLPTPAALTQGNDTNVTLTLGGTPATALLQAASITAGWTGTLAGSRGGLGAAITASNGGIYYSNASNGALLSGTATANQMLQSGASTTPAWSTTTWPATSTINQLLYSSAANVIAGVTVVNSAGLTTTSGGVPTWVAYTGTGAPVLATSPTLVTPTLGAATATSLAFSPTTGGIIGTTAADNAGAGKVGELLSSANATGVAQTTAVTTNIQSLTLTAGDWDVWGIYYTTVGGTTVQQAVEAQLNPTTATLSTPTTAQLTSINGSYAAGIAGIAQYFNLGISRWNVSGNTSVFLNANSSYTVSTLTGNGAIYARRVR